MENYHLAEAFKLINSDPNCNIFINLSSSEKKLMRKRIINMVLATDMTMHKKEQDLIDSKLGIMKSKSNQMLSQDLSTTGNNSRKKNKSMLSNYIEEIEIQNLINLQEEFLNILIHTADISNPTKPLNLYNKWTDLVVNEFWRQGDIEKEMNLAVSLNCDRVGASIPKIQKGFIDNVVFPLFNTVVEIFPNLEFVRQNLIDNKKFYDNEILQKK